ncbi:hypothetical protein HK096_008250, partial [Nowakowskiella sp. JEL0078]
MSYTAVLLHQKKKKWISALNVTQTVLLSARNVFLLFYGIAPGLQNTCDIRRYG